ncbi:uncharacterized protein H6S33_006525 [Morchella sextelata]|uniref:uncharacterized protein n=1 Tax=Morchella sextelata TaxID=1174677 RepID=UPI001D04140E|nr:uncharacterized protein H6S33_006525 [Morchella sextelata]KAH0604857.1 hypothetical protein H6S33_006525 [Morchella sextelata]
MRICTVLLSLLSLGVVYASPVLTGNVGFNIGHKRADGACKTTDDWIEDFRTIRSWSHDMIQVNTARLFSTSDCFNLKNAVPAAQATYIKIWVTIWATPEDKYIRERDELKYAIRTWGTDWIAGINVGSEHLYQGSLKPATLARYINQVKMLVKVTLGAPYIAIGCADTWNQLVSPAAKIVLGVSDVVLANGFPYWQGIPIEAAGGIFTGNFNTVRNLIPDKPIIVGETGWPSAGPSFEGAQTSVANLQRYWYDTACPLVMKGIPVFWFSAFDEPAKDGENGDVEKHFGVASVDRHLKISLNC